MLAEFVLISFNIPDVRKTLNINVFACVNSIIILDYLINSQFKYTVFDYLLNSQFEIDIY